MSGNLSEHDGATGANRDADTDGAPPGAESPGGLVIGEPAGGAVAAGLRAEAGDSGRQLGRPADGGTLPSPVVPPSRAFHGPRPVPAPHHRGGSPRTLALALILTGLLLSGCGMTDDDSPGNTTGDSQEARASPPGAGTATTEEAVAAVKEVSGELHRFAGVPGKASEPGPGVKECAGKDPDAYFTVYHPWNFAPSEPGDLDVAMENLKKRLHTGGWVTERVYRDNSRNKALNLIADNDAKKVSVWIVQYSEDAAPSLGINVTSGCYRVPEGETVDHF